MEKENLYRNSILSLLFSIRDKHIWSLYSGEKVLQDVHANQWTQISRNETCQLPVSFKIEQIKLDRRRLGIPGKGKDINPLAMLKQCWVESMTVK